MFSHIGAYLFVDLDDLEVLRDQLLTRAKASSLKGTILLATEGINLYLCGVPEAIDEFLSELRRDTRFANIDVKTTSSASLCYKRLLVKIKREIITFGHPTLRPADSRAPGVDASDLRRWLDVGHDDEGRELVLLDTRNQFEVDAGTFVGAESLGIEKFSELADAASAHLEQWNDKTVVTFCTGGIRCEKAALYLQDQGVPNVVQLEGGVLRYFEQEHNAHWEGDLFVFDQRRGLTPNLSAAT
jgi:UPF0176 protein